MTGRVSRAHFPGLSSAGMKSPTLARTAVFAAMALALLCLLPELAPASTAPPSANAAGDPLVSTFSIVALDPATGDLGIAVQSKFPNVRAVVPWTRAGVGAVATQSFAKVSFGERRSRSPRARRDGGGGARDPAAQRSAARAAPGRHRRCARPRRDLDRQGVLRLGRRTDRAGGRRDEGGRPGRAASGRSSPAAASPSRATSWSRRRPSRRWRGPTSRPRESSPTA